MTIPPVALTSVIMKCFERLVKDHITFTLPVTLNPLQFSYLPNRSTGDAITITLPYPIWTKMLVNATPTLLVLIFIYF